MRNPLTPQTLVPGIMEAIRDQILKGTLPAGAPLRQSDLARNLRVSPVPLREALRGLEAEGFVTFHPFRGAEVTPVTVEEVLEVQEIAMALELALARVAFPRLAAEDFRHLHALCDALDQPTHSPATALEFYHALFRPAGRPRMLRLIETMIWRTARFFPIVQAVHHRFQGLEPTRRTLVRAIESGDLELAKRHLVTFNQIRVDAIVDALREADQARGARIPRRTLSDQIPA